MKEPRSCGFLIVRGNPIESFLLMRHPDRWDLPKGHVDPGETDLQCALRELEEETGIRAGDIEIIDGFLYENRYPVSARRYDQGSGTLEKTLRIFLARLHNDIDLSLTEHHGYQWFDWNPPHDLQVKTINPLLETLQEFLRDQQTS